MVGEQSFKADRRVAVGRTLYFPFICASLSFSDVALDISLRLATFDAPKVAVALLGKP